MKSLLGKGLCGLMSMIPVFAMFMLVVNSNSTACWGVGQPEPPKSIKSYRKF